MTNPKPTTGYKKKGSTLTVTFYPTWDELKPKGLLPEWLMTAFINAPAKKRKLN